MNSAIQNVFKTRCFLITITVSFFTISCTHLEPSASEWKPKRGHSYSVEFENAMDSAKTGNPSSQLDIGLMYYFGRGVKISLDDAWLWIRRSADEGNYADAQFAIGNLAQLGEIPTWENMDVSRYTKLRFARYYYRKASVQGHEKAMLEMARVDEEMSSTNPYIDSQTANVASQYQYRPLAKKGIAEAQYSLGLLLSQVEPFSDYHKPSREAFLWLSIAKINGIKKAGKKLRELASFMPTRSYCPIKVLVSRCLESNYQNCSFDPPNNPKCLTEIELYGH